MLPNIESLMNAHNSRLTLDNRQDFNHAITSQLHAPVPSPAPSIAQALDLYMPAVDQNGSNMSHFGLIPPRGNGLVGMVREMMSFMMSLMERLMGRMIDRPMPIEPGGGIGDGAGPIPIDQMPPHIELYESIHRDLEAVITLFDRDKKDLSLQNINSFRDKVLSELKKVYPDADVKQDKIDPLTKAFNENITALLDKQASADFDEEYELYMILSDYVKDIYKLYGKDINDDQVRILPYPDLMTEPYPYPMPGFISTPSPTPST